jgi:hypothetical protein
MKYTNAVGRTRHARAASESARLATFGRIAPECKRCENKQRFKTIGIGACHAIGRKPAAQQHRERTRRLSASDVNERSTSLASAIGEAAMTPCSTTGTKPNHEARIECPCVRRAANGSAKRADGARCAVLRLLATPMSQSHSRKQSDVRFPATASTRQGQTKCALSPLETCATEPNNNRTRVRQRSHRK